MTNYKSFAIRIEKAKSLEELRSLEKSLDRLYNARVLTVGEYSRLDGLILNKFDKV